MTSHMQVGVGGGTGCTPLNRIFNQNYEKHRIPTTTTGGLVVGGDGSPGMDRMANGQLSNSNSSSSLDYLYQAISLIEQKNSANSNNNNNNNVSNGNKMLITHSNSSVPLHSHLNNNNNNNNNHNPQPFYHQQARLNVNEVKDSRLVRGNTAYQQIPNSTSYHLDATKCTSTHQFQHFNQPPNQVFTNDSLYLGQKSSPNNENNNNSHFNCNCTVKTQQHQRKTSPGQNMPYYNHYQYNQNQMNGINMIGGNNVGNLTSGKAVTPSRLEKAKQLARNHHYLAATSSSNQAYLPPSPISSTCSVSNLSSLSSSVSVSPSSLSSSPSSVFNNNNNNNNNNNLPNASLSQQYQHQMTDVLNNQSAAQSMILSNLLPFYANNDYLKNLISTVYALTSYQHQQQQLQQQQQYNEQLRSSFAKLTKPTVTITTPTTTTTSPQSSINDVNSQVDEHFRRSLGTHYYNTIFAPIGTTTITNSTTNQAQTQSKTKLVNSSKKIRLTTPLHLTSKKPKLVLPHHHNHRNQANKFSSKIKQIKLQQIVVEQVEATPVTKSDDYEEIVDINTNPNELNETASLNASMVKHELYNNVKKNDDDNGGYEDLVDKEEEVNDDDDDVQEFSLTCSSSSSSPSPSTSSFSSFGSERDVRAKVSSSNKNANKISMQPIVDTHFSKALGIETWNKLKTNGWPPLSASSPVHSSSSSSSYSTFKCNQDNGEDFNDNEDSHDDDDDDDDDESNGQNTEDEIESELKREQNERKKKQALASAPCTNVNQSTSSIS